VWRSWQMGVGKLVQMATLNRLGSAARDVQERVSNTASGRGTGVNWYGTPTMHSDRCKDTLRCIRSARNGYRPSVGRTAEVGPQLGLRGFLHPWCCY